MENQHRASRLQGLHNIALHLGAKSEAVSFCLLARLDPDSNQITKRLVLSHLSPEGIMELEFSNRNNERTAMSLYNLSPTGTAINLVTLPQPKHEIMIAAVRRIFETPKDKQINPVLFLAEIEQQRLSKKLGGKKVAHRMRPAIETPAV